MLTGKIPLKLHIVWYHSQKPKNFSDISVNENKTWLHTCTFKITEKKLFKKRVTKHITLLRSSQAGAKKETNTWGICKILELQIQYILTVWRLLFTYQKWVILLLSDKTFKANKIKFRWTTNRTCFYIPSVT